MRHILQVFEHGCLQVDGERFTTTHFNRLVQYNEHYENRYFEVGHGRIYFRHYVGVIQVGNLTIEILPKADRSPVGNKIKWRGILLEMLRQTGVLEPEIVHDATLRLQNAPLLDLYFDAFLSAVEQLTHHGLVRKYRLTTGNLGKLKGRLLFRQQIAKNLMHPERVFTAHEEYDRNNLFNQILKKAVSVVGCTSTNNSVSTRAQGLGLVFEDIAEVLVTEQTFSRLRFDRNTERYRRAIQLARLIILNYAPDLQGGRESVLAILFDMNRLFERFIYVQMKRAEPRYRNQGLTITGQGTKQFWGGRRIRPDIQAAFKAGPLLKCVILDTKWKLPKTNEPEDADIQQMYVYNVHFGSGQSVLVYPAFSGSKACRTSYATSTATKPDFQHDCRTYYVELVSEEGGLRQDIGKVLIEDLVLSEQLGPNQTSN